jgi:hypothetical protein
MAPTPSAAARREGSNPRKANSLAPPNRETTIMATPLTWCFIFALASVPLNKQDETTSVRICPSKDGVNTREICEVVRKIYLEKEGDAFLAEDCTLVEARPHRLLDEKGKPR